MSPENPEYEYIVVGSGAGGGTVAARLAEAGCSVLLLEAGGDPRQLSGNDPVQPDANRLPYDYDVPAFHAFASENEAMKWDFFVRHYQDESQQKLDWKYVEKWQDEKVDGVLYPRAGTLGGCTAHNAQIFVYPQNSDWKYIEELTGDATWSPESMREVFEGLENCHHRPIYRLLSKLGINPTRHGWKGWLRTEKAIPKAAIEDGALFDTIAHCAEEEFFLSKDPIRKMNGLLNSWADPNDWRPDSEHLSGVCYTPLTTRNHQRIGARERVLETSQRHPNLKLQLHALATKILFDGSNRATGVEFLRGERLYRASAQPRTQVGELQRAHASKEVILAGGAFNTPQLLMLSGVGSADMLSHFGIDVRVDLPGVGRNLQDRYEIGIVHRMNFPEWNLYRDIKFAPGDPQFKQWQRCRAGIYTTNGAVLSAFKRSAFAEGSPDLFCMALLTDFQGYYPGYSKILPEKLNCLTWVVLKAHTKNRAGEVVLRSADPLDTPLINFRYFEEGGDEDLNAVLDGVHFVRKLTEGLRKNHLVTEEMPGEDVKSDDDLRAFIRNNAWGHHASCTCAIGPREKNGVLNGNFQVHGTQGLRVVDASVFPRIPGTFIVSAIYMVAEKAAQVILASK